MNLYGNLDAAGRCQMAPLQKNQHPEDADPSQNYLWKTPRPSRPYKEANT